MSSVLTPQKTEQGWGIEMPPVLARSVGVNEGSRVILYSRDGQLDFEVLPPLSAELRNIVQQILEEEREFHEELKRLGD